MLQLETSNLDIIKVSKILAKFKINASTSNTNIILNDGEISEELINALITSGITINSVRNFIGETIEPIFEDFSLGIETDNNSTGFIMKDNSHKTKIPANCQEYNLLFPTVKRGEVYLCDFGEPYGSECGYIHPAVIIQNDELENINNHCTIVLGCSSSDLKPSRFKFICSTNLEIFTKKTAINITLIKYVSKLRLRQFLGTLDDETMEHLQPCIDFALGLKRD